MWAKSFKPISAQEAKTKMAAHVAVCEIYAAIFCSIPDTELIHV